MKVSRVLALCLLLAVAFLPLHSVTAQEDPPPPGMQVQSSNAGKYPFETEWVIGEAIDGLSMTQDGGGHPYIAFYNHAERTLYFAERVSSGGNCGDGNRWKCSVVATTTGMILYPSIDYHYSVGPYGLVTRTYGISFFDSPGSTLKYARLNCSLLGCGSWAVETIQAGDLGGANGLSMQFDQNGAPHVLYTTNHAVSGLIATTNVLLASKESGAWTIDLIQTSGPGIYDHPFMLPSLSIDSNGDIAAGYYNYLQGVTFATLAVVGEGNCGPSGTEYVCYNLEQVGEPSGPLAVGWTNSGGNIGHIVYIRNNGSGNYDLRYASFVPAPTSENTNCGYHAGIGINRWQCDTIEAIGYDETFSKNGISLAIDAEDNLAIAYQNNVAPNQGLRVAYPRWFGNCGPKIPLFSFEIFTWQCDSVVGSGSPGDYLSLEYAPNGLLHMAYYDQSGYGTLYYTTQKTVVYLPAIVR